MSVSNYPFTDELLLICFFILGVKNIIMAASVDGKMTPYKSFMVGAISKTLATVVTFPYILSKIRLQAKDTKYTGAFDVLASIAKQKGISGWYQGMQAQITKAVLAQALLFYFRGEL
jgi:adenine nucleotide transporter 17